MKADDRVRTHRAFAYARKWWSALIIVAFAWPVVAAPQRLPLFETMLEERAFVTDLRATVGIPTVRDHLRARGDWPLSPGLCHRIESEVEAQFGRAILRTGQFYLDRLPDLPRLLMRIEFKQVDMSDARPSRDKRTYARVLNGTLTVTLLPSGHEVAGIPLRVRLIRDAYGEYDAFRALRLIDLDGRRVTNVAPRGDWDLARITNEPILIDALWTRDAACASLLSRTNEALWRDVR